MKERLENLLSLDRRQWTVGVLGGLAYMLVVAIPTDLIDTPIFGREIPPTWWAWPSLLVTTLLVAVLTATYIKPTWQKEAEDAAAARRTGALPDSESLPGDALTPPAEERPSEEGPSAAKGPSAEVPSADSSSATIPDSSEEEPPSKAGMLGAALAYFAVGCPVCNKLVLLALGWNGAITWFEPFQPVLQVAAVVLLVWALERRLKNLYSCEPSAPRQRATATA